MIRAAIVIRDMKILHKNRESAGRDVSAPGLITV